MAYAQTSDVVAELGRPASSPTETAQWQAWLDRVERSIERGFRRAGLKLAEAITAGDVTEGDVVDVEVGRVIAKIQNPDSGEDSVTRSVDDASVTYRRRNVGEPLELTDGDWSSLLPSSATGAFSIRPGFEPDRIAPDLWV